MERVSSLNLDALPPDWIVRDGIHDLRRAISQTGAKLVVFDALLDNMPAATGGENINSAPFARGALSPLQQLVRELEIVAVVSLHPPKSRGFAFRDFVQGSQAFSAVCRIGLLFAWHPDDAEDDPDRRRVIVRGKGNLGRNPGALEFRVTGRDHLHGDGLTQEREVVVDVAPSSVTLGQVTARPRNEMDETPSKGDDAARVLQEHLADGEWHPSAPIRDGLSARDLNSDSVVQRAKQLAGVESRKAPGDARGAWEWRISKNPRIPRDSTTDFSTENSADPQCSREESKNPPSLTTDSLTGALIP